MKHKRIFLIALVLVLFVFQQTHASAELSLTKGNPSQFNLPQSSGLPTQVNVTVLRLNSLGAPLLDARGKTQLCKSNDGTFGCVEPNNAGKKYPYGNNNPVSLVVETEYLTNVLPREMDVIANNPPQLSALEAQSLAARSIADWKYRAHNGYIDNSTNNQIFVPLSFVYYTRSNTPLSAPADPCNENGGNNTLNALQGMICNAVITTHGQYVASGGFSIDAEYGSDMKDRTITEPVPNPKSYLKGVEDPISTTCGAVTNSNGYGMSQKGAMRWARGNQCATAGEGSSPWSVKWLDYRQILVHYYTGIDILDSNGNKVAPDDRWNLLYHNAPSQMTHGQTYTVTLSLQNTSTSNWIANDVILGYQWTPAGSAPQINNWQPIGTLPSISAGGPQPLQYLNVQITAPPTAGVYSLHLDLKHQSGNWFTYGSNGGWTPAEISPILVDTFQVNQGSDDGGKNPTPCAFSATDNEVYLGACFGGADIISGFRFNNIPISCDATIQNAYIIFSVDGMYTVPVTVQIYGEANANSATFSISSPPESRPTTNSSVLWNITDTWHFATQHNTPDLTSIIQEIVSCSNNWNSGNSLSIIITNAASTNVRRVIAFERAMLDPDVIHPARLVINYTP